MQNAIPSNWVSNVGWFDTVVILVLLVGVLRGRKLGISQDLLDLVMWIGITVGGAFAYKPLAVYVVQYALVGKLYANIIVYLLLAVVCFVIKVSLADLLRDKIANSDFFGRAEYPFGMISGGVRYLLALMAALALINSREYTIAELAAEQKEIVEVYNGNRFFPTWSSTQKNIFQESFSGKFVKDKLNVLLLAPTAAPRSASAGDNMKSKKNKEMDNLMGR